MSDNSNPKPVDFTIKTGETKTVDFKGTKAGMYQAILTHATRNQTPDSKGKLTVHVSYQDTASDAEDIDNAPIQTKTMDLITFEANEFTQKEVTFKCVDETEAKFTLEGNGEVQIIGFLTPFENEDDDEEEDETEDDPEDEDYQGGDSD